MPSRRPDTPPVGASRCPRVAPRTAGLTGLNRVPSRSFAFLRARIVPWAGRESRGVAAAGAGRWSGPGASGDGTVRPRPAAKGPRAATPVPSVAGGGATAAGDEPAPSDPTGRCWPGSAMRAPPAGGGRACACHDLNGDEPGHTEVSPRSGVRGPADRPEHWTKGRRGGRTYGEGQAARRWGGAAGGPSIRPGHGAGSAAARGDGLRPRGGLPTGRRLRRTLAPSLVGSGGVARRRTVHPVGSLAVGSP